jgi:hypothetical protein
MMLAKPDADRDPIYDALDASTIHPSDFLFLVLLLVAGFGLIWLVKWSAVG